MLTQCLKVKIIPALPRKYDIGLCCDIFICRRFICKLAVQDVFSVAGKQRVEIILN